jgi:acyl-CoA reductase-like NAD-dependent aldehyde dehydrogenase
VLDRVGAMLGGVQMGPSVDPASQMGPIVHSDHLAALQARIDELVALGGEAHSWTTVPEGPGNWLAPTLITGVDPKHTETEIFGPVATVHPYESIDEAVALANATPYGLEAYVFGGDEEQALAVARRITAGGVKVNGASPISLHLMAPRPAWGVSGLYDEGTLETIQFFMGATVLGVEGPMPGGPPPDDDSDETQTGDN